MAEKTANTDIKPCQRCGNNFAKPAKYSNDQWSRKSFCSRRCAALKRRMSDHEICSIYAAGKSSAEISQIDRISAVQVLRVLRANGVSIRCASENKKLAMSKPDVRRRMSDSRKGTPCPEHVKAALSKRVGQKNHNWRNGLTMTAGGYLAFTTSPANGDHAGRLLHQVIAEWAANRRCDPGEHVHHKDGDKLNNRPDNLVIISASDHLRLHALESGLGKHKRKAS